jgi:hypothetical protein
MREAAAVEEIDGFHPESNRHPKIAVMVKPGSTNAPFDVITSGGSVSFGGPFGREEAIDLTIVHDHPHLNAHTRLASFLGHIARLRRFLMCNGKRIVEGSIDVAQRDLRRR